MADERFADILDGAEITGVVPLAADPAHRSLRVDGRIRARLRTTDVEALGLVAGRRWSSDLAAAVSSALARDAARREALRLLGRSDRSTAALRERLRRRHDPAIVEAVLEEMRDHGWLEDERFARTAARSIADRGGATAPLVAARLVARGVDPALAERTAQECLAGVDPVEEAVRYAGRHSGGPRAGPSTAATARVAARLARRGFDEDTVRAALARLGLPIEDEHGAQDLPLRSPP